MIIVSLKAGYCLAAPAPSPPPPPPPPPPPISKPPAPLSPSSTFTLPFQTPQPPFPLLPLSPSPSPLSPQPTGQTRPVGASPRHPLFVAASYSGTLHCFPTLLSTLLPTLLPNLRSSLPTCLTHSSTSLLNLPRLTTLYRKKVLRRRTGIQTDGDGWTHRHIAGQTHSWTGGSTD